MNSIGAIPAAATSVVSLVITDSGPSEVSARGSQTPGVLAWLVIIVKPSWFSSIDICGIVESQREPRIQGLISEVIHCLFVKIDA